MKIVKRLIRLTRYRHYIFSKKIGKKNKFSYGNLFYENSIIGKYNYFAPNVIVNNAVIGNYCSLGPDCKIGLSEHDYKQISTRRIVLKQKAESMYDFEKPSIIENDVWIGANVIIKQGVKIGNGAVIGACSFVNKDIPPFAIAFGTPAKVYKYRFSQEKIKIIIDSNWYNLDLKEAIETVEKIEMRNDLNE